MTDTEIPEIWFEKIIRRAGLPMWAGAAAVGAGPFTLLGLLTLLVPGPPGTTAENYALFILSDFLFILFASFVIFYTAKYLRREITDLLRYAKGLEAGSSEEQKELDLSSLSSTLGILMVYVALVLFTVPLFTIGQPGSIIDNLISEIPFLWFNVLLATFFWTFGYSMYAIHRMGKLPMKLRSYTQDRTLGLKPFATASLNSTLVYFGFVTALVLLVVLGGAIPFELALSFAGLYPIGLLLFLLPLRSLHSKLVEEKARKLAWLEPRATALLEKLESEGSLPVDQATVTELTVVDKLQKDIQQIRTWPFDTGIIGRLLAILISVTAILLSAYIKNLLPGLH